MIRRIIEIDKEKCNGCGLCANACHEGAIGMVDGKATLLREDVYKRQGGKNAVRKMADQCFFVCFQLFQIPIMEAVWQGI